MTDSEQETLQILKFLEENPRGLTLTQISRMVRLNRVSAARYLDRMVLTGQVDLRAYGRSHVYTLASRVSLANILDLVSSPVILLDEELFVRDVNSPLLQMFGVKKEDLLDHQIGYTPLVPFFPETIIPVLKSALGGTPVSLEQSVHLQGKTTYFILKVTPVVFGIGKTGIAIVHENITAIRHREQDLEKKVGERVADLKDANRNLSEELDNERRFRQAVLASQQKYRTLVEDMPAFICCFDADGTISFVNDNLCRVVGKKEEEILGTSVFSWLAKGILEGVTNEGMLKAYKSLNSSAPTRSDVVSLYDGNGNRAWYKWMTRAFFTKNGHITEYQTIGIDISDTARAEENRAKEHEILNAVIQGSPPAQFVINTDHEVVIWNAAMERFSGISASQILGTRISGNFFYSDERPMIADLLVDEMYADISRYYPVNCRRSSQDPDTWEGIAFSKTHGDSGAWVFFTAVAIRDSRGKISHVVETLIDLLEVRMPEGRAFYLKPAQPFFSRPTLTS